MPQQSEAIALTLFGPLAARRQKLMGAINALARRMPRLPLPVLAPAELDALDCEADLERAKAASLAS